MVNVRYAKKPDAAQQSRRNFLKMSAAAAAGCAVAGKFAPASAKQSAWTDKMAINPAIDNMKVVCCHDPAILKTGATFTSFAAQNNGIDAARVGTDLDDMAIRLAWTDGQPQPSADAAWKTILRSGKAWADTVVAIKVNAVNLYNMPHMAIVSKLVGLLTGWGVAPANIVIYDGSTTASGNANYSPYFTLDTTDLTKVHAVVSTLCDALGGFTTVTLPSQAAGTTYKCATNIANGLVDIIINLAVNKGHDRINLSGFTGCMKNHYGTFWDPNAMHELPFIIDTNMHDAIIGGSPVRQQLCIIDSILACTDGPGVNYPPDVSPPPCRLVMGTFAPSLDWYVARRLREPNNWYVASKYNSAILDQCLSAFGYAPSDLDAIEFIGGQMGVLPLAARARAETSFEVRLSGSLRRQPSSAYFSLPRCEKSISIFDGGGRCVRQLSASPMLDKIVWDGKTSRGARASAGSYVVAVTAGAVTQSGIVKVGY
jgi:Domain of unknown function (DUF362)/TAT (twin-arginine translocation) pathway signal sequence